LFAIAAQNAVAQAIACSPNLNSDDKPHEHPHEYEDEGEQTSGGYILADGVP
jgi:hypothetical protein